MPSNCKYYYFLSPFFTNQLYATLSIDVKLCTCDSTYQACGALVPTLTLEPSAGASASLLVS